ncbi:MAG: sarcosine oxidase subunit delta, partial [Methylobacteriaceae bacterium]|nr:sarcosine oxidase subunit delta [Methylobacteriaceae bacterium]
MRIPCPYCGERGNAEYAYLGDAGVSRPQTPLGAA